MEVVYTYGVFDLLHYGHIKALKKAKEMGDKLIIGVFTDRVASGFKRQPIMSEDERFENIRQLDLGEVVLQDIYQPTQEMLDGMSVKVVTKAEGAGWGDEIPQWEEIKSVLIPYTKGISTSELIKRCLDKY